MDLEEEEGGGGWPVLCSPTSTHFCQFSLLTFDSLGIGTPGELVGIPE